MTTPAATCAQPGCGGTIVDGYCDICGMSGAPASTGGTAAGTSAGTRGSRGTRSGRTSGRSSRGLLGAGLVEIPPVPARDPATAILANPQVAENKRYCSACDRPVGRSKDGRPGRAEGFCGSCGTPYSFTPKLAPGDLVGGQYEVLGCLAHGGMGWIYLAKDRNVSDSWRVLKGLLNTADADAMAAAVAERQFLAAVDHPNIVRIYNFVQHADASGQNAGYIVMEYVGGRSLRQILLDARAAGESVPVEHALAYAIEVLRALGYLHNQGLVYCDFKPDNVIQSEEMLKLIDMGGVRRIDDEESAIYGTVGYQAPEIAADGPSPSSDLYTVGRSLAVLTFDFTGYTTTYKDSLPDPASVPALTEQESFYRLLRRSTSSDPGQRFDSAGEMAEQLTGVLREVLARKDGQPRPAFSSLFSPELEAVGADPDRDAAAPPPDPALVASQLPLPVVDNTDPAAGYLATLSSLTRPARLAALTAAVAGAAGTPAAVAESAETRLALARAQILARDRDGAAATLTDLEATAAGDWRISWYRGLRELAGNHGELARAWFDQVYDAAPGELAPKLALAFAAEAAGDLASAARYFRLVWTIDHSYVSAAFGLSRALAASGNRPGAVAALAAVPPSSSHYLAAQVQAVRIQLAHPADHALPVRDVREAAGRLSQLAPEDARRQLLATQVLRAALDQVSAGLDVGRDPLLDCPPNERGLRFGLERGYRALARLATDPLRRIELVDQANQVRPRTLI